MSASCETAGRFRELPAPARQYMLAVILAAAAAGALQLGVRPIGPSASSLILALTGGLLGSRAIQIAPKINLAVIHPFIFAALVLDGATAALLVSLTSTLGATLLKRRRMTLSQIGFNLAVVLLSSLLGALVYAALLPAGAAPTLELAALPVLAASLAFFLANSALVAVVVGLERGTPIVQAWRDHSLGVAPSFLAGGALGLVMALALASAWRMWLVLALPFAYLIHYSYRLYSERLREQRERIEAIDKLNAQLEQKVRDRTEELVQVNGELRRSNQLLDAKREEVGRQNARLVRLEQSRQDLVRMLVHDLKNPLGAIQLGLEMLDQMPGDDVEAARRTRQNVSEAARKLGRMVHNILDVSCLEETGLALHLAGLSLAGLAADTAGTFRAAARSQDIDLLVALPEGEELPEVRGDADILARVLENLVANALDHSDEGAEIRIELAAAEGGSAVCIGVADRGCGVPEHLREAIFEKYERGDAPGAARFGNHGLGLSFCKLAVEAHGGRIWVEPREGGGSRFRFSIPAGTQRSARGA